jgi:probable F420-dependent oxidoreductase
MVVLSFAGAATTRLLLMTLIYVLPYRNPFVAAHAALSVDVLSRGRLVLGVGAGYLRSEFEALGADFNARNDAIDTGILAMKRAWTTDDVRYAGPGFSARGNTMRPRPAASPHPPIWIGGNSDRAIRRAVSLGQGWIPLVNPPERAPTVRTPALTTAADLAGRIHTARDYAADIGRSEALEICCAPLGSSRLGPGPYGAQVLDECSTLAELGVTWISVRFDAATRRDWLERVAAFGEAVIDAMR